MPCLGNLLILVQVAVGLATLVYMILKIIRVRKGWDNKTSDE